MIQVILTLNDQVKILRRHTEDDTLVLTRSSHYQCYQYLQDGERNDNKMIGISEANVEKGRYVFLGSLGIDSEQWTSQGREVTLSIFLNI